MTASHRVYLIPGMFGFGTLAGYDYFEHVERALAERFERRGVPCEVRVVPTPPTASIRRRARVAADTIFRDTDGHDGPIHLVGHSTGGLDARLLVSPSAALELRDVKLAWRPRVRSVVSMNTPHYGTPVAGFFATVSGTRLLYVLSLLTVTTLSVGGAPLGAVSGLVAALSRMDKALGLDIKLLDRAADLLLRVFGDQGREEVRRWLEGIQQDQGGVIQLTPEGMDLFTAAVDDASDVRYGCMIAAGPPPAPMRFLSTVRSPYAALSAAIYSALYTVASRPHPHYPFPEADAETLARIDAALGHPSDARSNDGVVPTLSMLWGELLWVGAGDHLDSVGHFDDDASPPMHTDWLTCGAHFGRSRFDESMDALADFLMAE